MLPVSRFFTHFPLRSGPITSIPDASESHPLGSFASPLRNVKLAPELKEAAAKVQEEVTAAYEEAERALELMRQEGETEELAAE